MHPQQYKFHQNVDELLVHMPSILTLTDTYRLMYFLGLAFDNLNGIKKNKIIIFIDFLKLLTAFNEIK